MMDARGGDGEGESFVNVKACTVGKGEMRKLKGKKMKED